MELDLASIEIARAQECTCSLHITSWAGCFWLARKRAMDAAPGQILVQHPWLFFLQIRSFPNYFWSTVWPSGTHFIMIRSLISKKQSAYLLAVICSLAFYSWLEVWESSNKSISALFKDHTGKFMFNHEWWQLWERPFLLRAVPRCQSKCTPIFFVSD